MVSHEDLRKDRGCVEGRWAIERVSLLEGRSLIGRLCREYRFAAIRLESSKVRVFLPASARARYHRLCQLLGVTKGMSSSDKSHLNILPT